MKRALPISASCQKCHQLRETTRRREVYAKNYTGPCADSFCYASCDSTSCRPMVATICDECAAKLGTPEPRRKS